MFVVVQSTSLCLITSQNVSGKERVKCKHIQDTEEGKRERVTAKVTQIMYIMFHKTSGQRHFCMKKISPSLISNDY
jgi:hypothetical protein